VSEIETRGSFRIPLAYVHFTSEPMFCSSIASSFERATYNVTLAGSLPADLSKKPSDLALRRRWVSVQMHYAVRCPFPVPCRRRSRPEPGRASPATPLRGARRARARLSTHRKKFQFFSAAFLRSNRKKFFSSKRIKKNPLERKKSQYNAMQ
jgi:hypothetical protein